MKKLLQITLAFLLILSCSITAFAHSGRTDSSGGHKDNKNASGLGSYHYHHGQPPHLHPNGVCPYAVSTEASNSSSQKDTGGDAPIQKTPETTISLTQAEQELVSNITTAIQQAQRDGKTAVFYTIKNGEKLSLDVMKEIGRQAKNASKTITLYCDVIEEEKVKARLAVNPELVTKSIVTTVSINNEQAQKTKEKYEKLYSNHVEVISLGQQVNFGMAVEIIAKVDTSQLNTDALVVYAYNPQANSHTQIPSVDCFIDDNKFVHIKTSLADDIVITNRPLALK